MSLSLPLTKWPVLLQSRRHLILLSSILFLLTIFWTLTTSPSFSHFHLPSQKSALTLPSQPNLNNYAYVLLLSDSTTTTPSPPVDDLIMSYIQTRTLLFQLLHDPQTRTAGYPVVVLVSSLVSPAKRQRLTDDGAEVVVVAKEDMRKLPLLQLFKLVQYDKVLFLSSDNWLTQSLDGIFEEAAVRHTDLSAKDEDALLPSQYVFAAPPSTGRYNHSSSPKPSTRVPNTGCLVVQPSLELAEYYSKVAAAKEFTSERDLWEDVHREDGGMAWMQLSANWSADFGEYEDHKSGVAAIQTRPWKNTIDLPLRFAAREAQWKMEGFWEAVDG